MPDPTITSRTGLLERIETAWTELHSFLDGLTDLQMTEVRDDQGWNVKDHIIHMAAWEESVAYLFEGRPRHEALGIDESHFANASFDEINAIVRDQRMSAALPSALGQFRRVHSGLVAHIQGLSDADLKEQVTTFFPQAPKSDERQVFDLLYDNTADHFPEHLGWIKTLVASRG